MPIRSPEEPAHPVRELGLPARAVTSLTRAGITDAAALAGLTRRELAAVPGLGSGMIAAIRAVVPEPPAVLSRAAAPGGAPDLAPDDESPAVPAIPSFESLRGPRRRSAVDLLLPEPPPAPATPPPTVASPPPPGPPAAASPPPPGPTATPPVRPPDYADLLRLGVHVARALAAAPARVTTWSARCLRRLLGG